jgi:type II secretory pathway pseudopilin PulG
MEMRHSPSRAGFTLLEVILAAVIGTFVALVAVGTLKTVIDARQRLEAATEVTDELRLVTAMLSNDIACLYRDPESAVFYGTVEDSGNTFIPSLTMRIVSTSKARRANPEGDVYEVQYSLLQTEEKSCIMRRCCPIVGIETEEETAGGILTTIAENTMFQVRYLAGEEWYDEWPREMDTLPEMVEFTIISIPPSEIGKPRDEMKNVAVKTFIANFPRMPKVALNKQYIDEQSEGEQQEQDQENTG